MKTNISGASAWGGRALRGSAGQRTHASFALRRTLRAATIPCAILILICAAAWFLFGQNIMDKKEHMPYAEFYQLVQDGEIEQAKFDGDTIYFRPKAHALDADEYTNRTENPYSPTLYETLLLKGVQVELAKDGGEIFTAILDVFFYIIFFGVIIIVFRKFISPNTFKVVRHTGVSFADIVGMDELKKYMLSVTDIMRHPADFAKKGVRAPKGVLLEGAPGNGKTLFARALATEAKVNFIPAKATDFESMFMAIGPMKVKLLFRKARRRAPCIVFIDEFDGIGTRRNYSGSALETENTRIVTALLNELDGFTANQGILVVAATNSIAALDEALIRPGRFDLRVQVPYPNYEERIQLVQMYIQNKPHAPDISIERLAKQFEGASAAQIESSLNEASLRASQDGRTAFTEADIQF
ncbi:MAG: AAA family ATPase [Treponema sp.]|nr:AAA family ATPase [Treponema sp.]